MKRIIIFIFLLFTIPVIAMNRSFCVVDGFVTHIGIMSFQTNRSSLFAMLYGDNLCAFKKAIKNGADVNETEEGNPILYKLLEKDLMI